MKRIRNEDHPPPTQTDLDIYYQLEILDEDNFSFCQNLNISTAANWSTIGKLKRVGSRCTLTIERINFVHFKGV